MPDELKDALRQAEAYKIQLQMSVLYKKNCQLFRTHLPDVYTQIKDHQPQQVVMQLDPNGHLNLVDKVARQFIYNEAPTAICEQQFQQFCKKQNVQRFKITTGEEYNPHHIHLKYIDKLINAYTEKGSSKLSNTITTIPTLIVSGVGLGYHLPLLVTKYSIFNLFIHEYSLDTFHSSLHSIDWEPILTRFNGNKRHIEFCIGKEPHEALTQLEFSIQNKGLHNYIFSFIYPHSNRSNEQQFIESYTQQMRTYIGGLGYYDDEQIGLAHGYQNIRAATATFKTDKPHYRKTRLLIIGNGPSLDLHVDYLQRNAPNCIVMSCGSSLGSLLKMGITPDFHVEMERTNVINDFLKLSTQQEQRQPITLLCLHTVSPEVIKLFGDACYAIKPNDAGAELVHQFFEPTKLAELGFCNPTVTNCAFAFAASMGFMEVHLIGVDFGIPSNGNHHSKNSFHYQLEDNCHDDKEFKYNYSSNNAALCPGNFGGTVTSHPILTSSRLALERLLRYVTKTFPEFVCYNSNHGAKIEFTQTIPLSKLADTASTKKQTLINQVKTAHFLNPDSQKAQLFDAAPLLKPFFQQHAALKIAGDINSEENLICEFNRIYRTIAESEDKISHFLLRGSINCLLGAITQHSLYCADKQDWQQRITIGREIYNQFIDRVYERMQTEAFRVDDTVDPLLSPPQ